MSQSGGVAAEDARHPSLGALCRKPVLELPRNCRSDAPAAHAGCGEGVAHVDSVLGHHNLVVADIGQLRRLPVYRSLREENRDFRLHRYYVGQLLSTLRIDSGDERLMWVRHHVAHAASAFFLSPFERANIISLDGNGGEDAGLYGVGTGSSIEVLRYVDREESWGVFYEGFTGGLGFRTHNDEGKVMGLAAYGDPSEGVFPFVTLNGEGGWPTYERAGLYEEIGRIRPRTREVYPIDGYYEHIAARLQFTLEAALARAAEELHDRTGLTDFCLAGGTALNCSANGKLLQLPFVERLFVQPAASDSGTALGAAVHAHVRRTGQRPTTVFDHAYWGPEYSNDEIETTLKQAKITYRRAEDVSREAANLIADDKIVGWFQGCMEVGPRALGNRSILANPGDPRMKDLVNKNVKFREPWRPFAPSILAEHMEEYFGTKHPSPFMILAFQAQPEIADRIPAALHVDGTGRPQTVDKATNLRYWHLIDEASKSDRHSRRTQHQLQRRQRTHRLHTKERPRDIRDQRQDAVAIGDFIVEKPQPSG